MSLYNLADNHNIIWKKADKGSNIVAWDRELYIKEAKQQLSDQKYYLKLDTDITLKYKSKVNTIVQELFDTKQITEKTYLYLMEGGTRTSVFYMLPKIHKQRDNPPGRPIISSVDCPTENISQVIDIILRPFTQEGNSLIRDSPDFIQKTKNIELSEQDWLITLDVTSLYTNIPHHKDTEKVYNLINQKRVNCLPWNEYVIKLLNLVLKCNNFKFNNKYFVQINGTTMGTQVAPTYTIIFMNWLEESKIVPNFHNLRYWWRFIDNIFAIFHGVKEDVTTFVEKLNQIHPSIKFTTYSKESVQFLDLK